MPHAIRKESLPTCPTNIKAEVIVRTYTRSDTRMAWENAEPNIVVIYANLSSCAVIVSLSKARHAPYMRPQFTVDQPRPHGLVNTRSPVDRKTCGRPRNSRIRKHTMLVPKESSSRVIREDVIVVSDRSLRAAAPVQQVEGSTHCSLGGRM